jgi:hypothetical protein
VPGNCNALPSFSAPIRAFNSVARFIDFSRSLYMAEEGGKKLLAQADCQTGNVAYSYEGNRLQSARFPLQRGADTSCASGMPPLIEQFKICAQGPAKRLRLD